MTMDTTQEDTWSFQVTDAYYSSYMCQATTYNPEPCSEQVNAVIDLSQLEISLPYNFAMGITNQWDYIGLTRSFYSNKPCDYFYSLLTKNLVFYLPTGESLVLEPWQYLRNKYKGKDYNGKELYYCSPNIKTLPQGVNDKIILGTSFMETYVTSLDYTSKKITLGKSVNAPVETFP